MSTVHDSFHAVGGLPVIHMSTKVYVLPCGLLQADAPEVRLKCRLVQRFFCLVACLLVGDTG